MNYVWEEELMPDKYLPNDQVEWKIQHHFKKCLPKTYGSAFDYKFSVAWVTNRGDRKWYCQFVNNNDESRTFRSLKAAKAYVVAIITLENT
jgi:monoamine oxidase